VAKRESDSSCGSTGGCKKSMGDSSGGSMGGWINCGEFVCGSIGGCQNVLPESRIIPYDEYVVKGNSIDDRCDPDVAEVPELE